MTFLTFYRPPKALYAPWKLKLQTILDNWWSSVQIPSCGLSRFGNNITSALHTYIYIVATCIHYLLQFLL